MPSREHLSDLLPATAEALRIAPGTSLDAIPAAAAAIHDEARNLRQQLDRVLARFAAAAPVADAAHRQLRAIREARAHSCDQSCTEGGCDFDLAGFVDRVDEILARYPAASGSSPRAQALAALFDRAALIARWEENFGFDFRSSVEVALAEQEADHVADLIALAVEAASCAAGSSSCAEAERPASTPRTQADRPPDLWLGDPRPGLVRLADLDLRDHHGQADHG